MRVIERDVKELVNGTRFYNGNLDNVVDVRVLRSLSNSILGTQTRGEETLYFCGKLIGSEFGRNFKAKNVDDAITSVNELMKRLNLGHVKRAVRKGRRLLIDVKDCPLCDPGKDRRCYFSAGILAGMLSRTLKRNVVGKETDCKNKKRDICTFELKFI
ncbi:MAG: V4R domain-containing protein [Candidatus Aenigmatarchaeota archaeon]